MLKGGSKMKKLITLILVSMSAFLLMACSKQSDNSLDGEYYWINENRKADLTHSSLVIAVNISEPNELARFFRCLVFR